MQPGFPEEIKTGRNTFLTVLCILTFIGSGWGIVDSFLDYSAADFAGNVAHEAIDEVQQRIAEEEEVPSFVSDILGSVMEGISPENIRRMSLWKFISCLLTLAGAILMWNLRKTGFWFYIAGIVILVVAPVVIFGKGLIGIAAAGVSGFFGVLFIVLYAVNLHQLK